MKKSQLIYHYIREQQAVSKQDIVVGLKLSLPTITHNLQYLEELHLIDTSDKIRNTGGRNATAYSYVKNARAAIGLYLTAHHINCVSVDLSGDVIQMIRRKRDFNLDDDGYLQEIGVIVEEVKRKSKIKDKDFLGVGISVPGLVSQDGEIVTYGMTLNFGGRTREGIAKYIPYRNKLFHDSIAAGYAEVWKEQDIQNAFYLSLSNSVGGAALFDKKIYEGNSQKGGEVGHMTVVPEGGEQCYCGRKGCFDTVCRSTLLDQYTDGNLERFFGLLDAGDAEAVRLWDKYLDNLSLGIHNLRMLFDSDIILGGYVGAYIEKYMEGLCDRIDARNPFGDPAREYLVPCKYKVEAAAAGAAIHFIDEFFESI